MDNKKNIMKNNQFVIEGTRVYEVDAICMKRKDEEGAEGRRELENLILALVVERLASDD